MPFYFNSNMVLLFKTFTTLEGVCKGLNDNFSYTTLYASIVRNIVDIEFVNTKMITDLEIVMRTTEKQSQSDYINNAKLNVVNEKVVDHNKLIYALIVATIIDLFIF